MNIARDIFGAIAIGYAGITQAFDFDNILAAMSIGFFLVNFVPASKAKPIFGLVSAYTPPVYVLFFVLVGAKLNIWIITPFLGLLAILYVLGRTVGKSIAATLGAALTHAPKSVQKFLPYCLLNQAGVAIGLSIAAGNDFADSVGSEILFNILNRFSHNQNMNYVVKNKNNELAGMITLDHLKEVMQIGDFAESMLAMDIMEPVLISCKPSTTLPEAYALFEKYDTDAIPIVDTDGDALGILEKHTVNHFLHAKIINLHRKLEEMEM